MKKPVVKIHRTQANRGRWVVPVTCPELGLDGTLIATAHNTFVAAGLPGELWYRREAWFATQPPAKFAQYKEALHGSPFVLVTNSLWSNNPDGTPHAERDGYIGLFRYSNLYCNPSNGAIHCQLVERFEVR
jgi:hypothetical protein